MVDCTTTGAPQSQSSAAMSRRLHGTNGDFSDHCDPAGMLIKYTCELTGACQPQAPCVQSATGKVVSQTIDCAGTCMSGACLPRCPTAGESLEYKSVTADGSATLQSQTTGRSYACHPAAIAPNPGYDCLASPQVGHTVVVTDSGDAGLYCTASTVHLVVGSTPVDPTCAYDCQVPN